MWFLQPLKFTDQQELRFPKVQNTQARHMCVQIAGDLYLEALYKRHDFPVVFTRAANLYGPHQQLYRIIPRTIIFAKLGRTITLHGGGKSRRAFIH